MATCFDSIESKHVAWWWLNRVETLRLGNLEEGLFTGDFEGWTKGFCSPPLGDSMAGALGMAPLMGNLKYKVFEGYTKCPTVGPSTI